MTSISPNVSNGEWQNVHGPRPSFTQIILPQERQLGAAVRRGWRWALQVHFLSAMVEVEEEREDWIWSSRARIAESWFNGPREH